MSIPKITAGLGSPDNYEALARAGADELFAGFVPLEYLQRYGNLLPLNRREVLMHNIQIDSFQELALLKCRIETHGVPVSLAFNSIHYLPEQYPVIADMLSRLESMGFQDWILADPALICYIRAQGLQGRIHLSGEAGCFNPDAITFFRRFAPSRIIFPRKITPEEMAVCIAAAPEIEYEAFMLNERCHFSGAFCASLHCDELEHMCLLPYRPCGKDMASIDPFETSSPEPNSEAFGTGGCGLCALPRLRRAGIAHLKVVGRGAHIEELQRDVSLLRRALSLGDVSANTLRREILHDRCGKNCYYPRFP